MRNFQKRVSLPIITISYSRHAATKVATDHFQPYAPLASYQLHLMCTAVGHAGRKKHISYFFHTALCFPVSPFSISLLFAPKIDT